MIDVSFSYTKSDYYDGYRAYYRDRLNPKLDLVVGFSLLAYGAYLVWDSGFSFISSLLLAGGIFLVGIVIASFWIIPPILYRRDRHTKGELRLVFDELGVRIEAADFESSMKWKLFKRVIMAEQMMILDYVGKIMIIPHRVFTTAQVAKLKALVEKHVQKVITV